MSLWRTLRLRMPSSMQRLSTPRSSPASTLIPRHIQHSDPVRPSLQTGGPSELRLLCACYMRDGQEARAYHRLKHAPSDHRGDSMVPKSATDPSATTPSDHDDMVAELVSSGSGLLPAQKVPGSGVSSSRCSTQLRKTCA